MATFIQVPVASPNYPSSYSSAAALQSDTETATQTLLACHRRMCQANVS